MTYNLFTTLCYKTFSEIVNVLHDQPLCILCIIIPEVCTRSHYGYGLSPSIIVYLHYAPCIGPGGLNDIMVLLYYLLEYGPYMGDGGSAFLTHLFELPLYRGCSCSFVINLGYNMVVSYYQIDTIKSTLRRVSNSNASCYMNCL